MIISTRPLKNKYTILAIASAILVMVILGFVYFQDSGELTLLGSQSIPASLDEELQFLILNNGLTHIGRGPAQEPAIVALGEALFFDKEISGNRDISCATCHHPLLHGGDGLALSIGTGGRGLGTTRKLLEDMSLIPRNAPEIFNRGAHEWSTMFWDGRVAKQFDIFDSPAADLLPAGLDSPLAVQAMFPPTSRDEMRGHSGDYSVSNQDMRGQDAGLEQVSFIVQSDESGFVNEVALYADDDLNGIWSALMDRLLAIPEYQTLFLFAYPQIAEEDLGFQHAANAIAAYEAAAFSFTDSPWDRYLAGEYEALPEEAKRGALLFYGEAGCANCHSGVLMTDQAFHNIGVPQLGPGKDETGLDYGRYLETGNLEDKFAFRTPPLRNAAITGPWMHNGAYGSLEETVRHHLSAAELLASFNGDLLPARVSDTFHGNDILIAEILSTLDPLMVKQSVLSSEEFDQLMAFLHAQSSPSAADLGHLVPESVPSMLPIWD